MKKEKIEKKILGTLLTLKKGKKPKSQSPTKEKGMQPYVDIKAFETGVIDNYTDDDKCLPCNDGDLLIVCDGSRSGYVGRAIKGYTGSTLAKISAEGVDNSYLYYFIQSMYRLLNTQMKGTGTPHLNVEVLRKAELVIPSIPEQKRIVDKIEELFSELDSAVEILKKTKEQLAVYRQSVLKEVFENVEASQVRLDDLCDFITKGTTPSKSEMNTETSSIPFIKVYNLTFDLSLDFSIDPTFVNENTHNTFLARSKVLPGDVLMNIVGPPMGKVSIVPETYPEWNMNQAIARFRCEDNLNNRYLAYFLGCKQTVEKMMRQSKATAGQFNLTLEICRNIQIPLPSIKEQKAIVSVLDKRLSVCKGIEKTVNDALAQAEAMRQSILKKAFEGSL